MNNDIVTRLRMSADLMQGFPQMKARHFNAEWVIEAADEIERLRELLVHGLTEGYDCKGCDLCEQLKAIHKEAVKNGL